MQWLSTRVSRHQNALEWIVLLCILMQLDGLIRSKQGYTIVVAALVVDAVATALLLVARRYFMVVCSIIMMYAAYANL